MFEKFLKFFWGVGLANVITIAGTILMARLYTPESIAVGILFLSVVNLFVLFFCMGFDQYYMREFQNYKKDQKSSLLGQSVKPVVFLFFVIFSLSFLIEGGFGISLFGVEDHLHLRLSLLTAFFYALEKFAKLYFRMSEMPGIYSAVQIVRSLTQVGALVFFGVKGFDYSGIIYSQIVASVSCFTLCFLLSPRLWLSAAVELLTISPSRKFYGAAVLYVWPFMPYYFVSWAVQNGDRFYLNGHVDATSLGVYLMGVKLVGVAKVVQNAFSTFVIPSAFRDFSELNKEALGRKYGRLFRASYDAVFVGCAMSVWLKPLWGTVLGAEYEALGAMLPLMLMTPAVYLLSEIPTVGISQSNKTYLHLYAGMASLGVLLVFLWILVPVSEVEGAVVAVFLSSLTFYGIRHWFGFKYFSITISYVHFLGQGLLTIILLFLALYSPSSYVPIFILFAGLIIGSHSSLKILSIATFNLLKRRFS